jgi:ribonuclease D
MPSLRYAAFLSLAIVALVSGADPAHASTKDAPAVHVTTLDNFNAQSDRVRRDMQPNGRYGRISAKDRQTVETDLDRIKTLLTERGSSAALRDAEQTEIINAQEEINALLTRNDSERLVCTLERRTGSKMLQKTCMTVADRDELRRKTQDASQQNAQNNPLNWDGS